METLNISNKNGGLMSNALPLIVTGGLKVNIGADSTGTAAGTASRLSQMFRSSKEP